mgnify:FL=1
MHDLKNPLIAVLAFARRIREGKGDVEKAAHAIWDSAQNMQKIVESTLDFARPVQPDMKQEDLTGILNRVCDSCKPKADESGVTLSLEVPPEPLTVAVDGHTMARALTNLVSNAVEASEAGQEVVVSAQRGGKNLFISIIDQGVGMDREALENVFVPFYTKKSKGTGLGMVIAKKIVEAHAGKITIDSRVGQGTQVTVELPARP